MSFVIGQSNGYTAHACIRNDVAPLLLLGSENDKRKNGGDSRASSPEPTPQGSIVSHLPLPCARAKHSTHSCIIFRIVTCIKFDTIQYNAANMWRFLYTLRQNDAIKLYDRCTRRPPTLNTTPVPSLKQLQRWLALCEHRFHKLPSSFLSRRCTNATDYRESGEIRA